MYKLNKENVYKKKVNETDRIKRDFRYKMYIGAINTE